MSLEFSKTSSKDLLRKCASIDNDVRFLDGVALGLMLVSEGEAMHSSIDLFHEWRQSADDLEIEPSKRCILFESYLKTFTRGKLLERKDDSLRTTPTRKRDAKARKKQEEDAEDVAFVADRQQCSNGSIENEKDQPPAIDLISSTSRHASEVPDKHVGGKQSDFDFNSEGRYSPISERREHVASPQSVDEKPEEVVRCAVCNQASSELAKMSY